MHHLLCLNSLDWCFVLFSPSSNTFIGWTPPSIKTCHEFWFGGVVLVQVLNCKAFGPLLYCSFGKPQHDISMVWSRLSLPYESIRDYPTCTLAWYIWSEEGLELIFVVWLLFESVFWFRNIWTAHHPKVETLCSVYFFLTLSHSFSKPQIVFNSVAWCIYWPTPSCVRHCIIQYIVDSTPFHCCHTSHFF